MLSQVDMRPTRLGNHVPWLVILALTLAACGRTEIISEPLSKGLTLPQVTGNMISALQVVVVSDDFAVGTPRVPFVLYDGPNRVSDAQEVSVRLFDLTQNPPEPGESVSATAYNDYAVTYWVISPEIPTAGDWGLLAQVVQANGTVTEAQFVIEVLSKTKAPTIGDAAIPSANLTLRNEPAIEKLSSDSEPNPDFYQRTIAEAMTNGRPSVIVFFSPGFCKIAICTSVLTSMKDVYAQQGARANFIHIEAYKPLNSELVLADEMMEWGFTSEPWTYVLDTTGRIAARLGGPVSPSELQSVLEPLLTKEVQ